MSNSNKLIFGEAVGAGTTATKRWPGGKGLFFAESAAWGGGNAKLQIKSPNGTAMDITSSTISANGYFAFEMPEGELQMVVTTTTSVYGYAVQIPTLI